MSAPLFTPVARQQQRTPHVRVPDYPEDDRGGDDVEGEGFHGVLNYFQKK